MTRKRSISLSSAFPWMDNKYKFQVANPFLVEVEIDLDTNKIVNAKLGKVARYGPKFTKCQGSCDFAAV